MAPLPPLQASSRTYYITVDIKILSLEIQLYEIIILLLLLTCCTFIIPASFRSTEEEYTTIACI